MRLEDYLKTLPRSILSGEEVELPTRSLREIFKFLKLNEKDVFYHFGCGSGQGIELAIKEFGVKKAVGIDKDQKKIEKAEKLLQKNNLKNWNLKCEDIVHSNFDDATSILFWFTDFEIIEKMMEKFKNLNAGTKILTIWSPLPGCLPSKIEFPYIINEKPFRKANNLKEQLLAIFDSSCIDFVNAWEYAERYTKAIGSPEAGNDRFLTILQSIVIWINAKNLGIACGEGIPPAIKNYIGILKTFFNIDTEYLLKKN